jgi:hypothetical protein
MAEGLGSGVKEVAHRLGCDDPLYFSRLYRRPRCVPSRVAARRLARGRPVAAPA